MHKINAVACYVWIFCLKKRFLVDINNLSKNNLSLINDESKYGIPDKLTRVILATIALEIISVDILAGILAMII